MGFIFANETEMTRIHKEIYTAREKSAPSNVMNEAISCHFPQQRTVCRCYWHTKLERQRNRKWKIKQSTDQVKDYTTRIWLMYTRLELLSLLHAFNFLLLFLPFASPLKRFCSNVCWLAARFSLSRMPCVCVYLHNRAILLNPKTGFL